MARRQDAHPVLLTARLRLRQFRDADADGLHACLSSGEATRFWNTPPHARRLDTERAVSRMIDCTPSYYRFWAVADLGSDRCIGMANYHDGHIRNRRAAIGYIIEPSLHRRGLATEAVTALIDHCFGTLGLHRLQALIQPGNAASRALVERLGFRREGVLRDNLRVGDEWRDELLYARLGTDAAP
ncbi:GNAT family N-acetyltransferase [Falsiroseomonas stagni]|uniref:Protein N-acetyltransferase, RimJ/RimL family n=1 Tax=Falsiroseomonas stagni DSM 19981 TaxID=1123062 RepID=A0A1I4DUK1_9PROT|nr:GNAT family protein [Falsiroseomonas stagni]SFK95917.1 Protein N-acetyltransferase, RimJ/RimL family [Falsiroseomonas stagni DSM 19981]